MFISTSRWLVMVITLTVSPYGLNNIRGTRGKCKGGASDGLPSAHREVTSPPCLPPLARETHSPCRQDENDSC
jgi:hypothetical protein